MEHRNLDSLKALLGVLTAAEVAEAEFTPDGRLAVVKFHRSPPPLVKTLPPTVPKDPINQQLAERYPGYAQLFGDNGFPKHEPPKDTPKAE